MKLFYLFLITITVKTIWAKNIKINEENDNVNVFKREYIECKFANSILGKDATAYCCDNTQVFCTDNHITKIKFENKLPYSQFIKNATFPNSFGSMPHLASLTLDYPFIGVIPSDIGDLKSLEFLHISSTRLTGPVPSSIGELDKLTYLDLSLSSFSGPIPTSIGNLEKLTTINISKNQFSGPIPDSIKRLTGLTHLYLYTNNLSGSIPSCIGNLTNLKYLGLHNNQLTGAIPKSIENLNELTYLELSNNKFSGEFPTKEIEKLENLKTINLSKNEELYGKIPNGNYDKGKCNYQNTKLCYLEEEKNPNCKYPKYYNCLYCKDSSISSIFDGYCHCNEGYSGVGYIECVTPTDNSQNDNNDDHKDNPNDDNVKEILIDDNKEDNPNDTNQKPNPENNDNNNNNNNSNNNSSDTSQKESTENSGGMKNIKTIFNVGSTIFISLIICILQM